MSKSKVLSFGDEPQGGVSVSRSTWESTMGGIPYGHTVTPLVHVFDTGVLDEDVYFRLLALAHFLEMRWRVRGVQAVRSCDVLIFSVMVTFAFENGARDIVTTGKEMSTVSGVSDSLTRAAFIRLQYAGLIRFSTTNNGTLVAINNKANFSMFADVVDAAPAGAVFTCAPFRRKAFAYKLGAPSDLGGSAHDVKSVMKLGPQLEALPSNRLSGGRKVSGLAEFFAAPAANEGESLERDISFELSRLFRK